MEDARPDVQIYNSRLDAFEVYHKEKELRLFAEPELPALGHGIAGSIGAAVANAAIYPISLLLTRAQTKTRPKAGEKAQVQHPLEVAAKIYSEEGIPGLYAGLSIDTVKHSLDSFLFFMAYNTIRQSRLKSYGGRKHLPVLDELAVGFLAGSFSKFFTSPLSNIVTRLQTAARGSGEKPTVASVAAKIREEKGIAGFWTGYSAQLVLTLNPSLTFFFHELLNKVALPKEKREHPPFLATFFLAALAKSWASCVTYPFTLAKARAQTTSSSGAGTESEKHSPVKPKRKSIFATVATVARDEGVSALYEGLELEVLKGFLSHGLTMVIKESAHVFILKLYWTILKLRKRYPDRDADVRAGLSRTLEAAKTARRTVQSQVGSAGELGNSIFDSENGTLEVHADSLVESTREWSRAVADDVFEGSMLKNDKNADKFKELLVDFISESSGKPGKFAKPIDVDE